MSFSRKRESIEKMELRSKKFYNRGQALLPLLILLLLVLTLGVGVLQLSIGGMLISSSSQGGEAVLVATEGALENGLMRILRNPSYSGESLQVGGIPCTISTSGSTTILMVASCNSGRSIRKIKAEISSNQGRMVVNNIKEIE